MLDLPGFGQIRLNHLCHLAAGFHFFRARILIKIVFNPLQVFLIGYAIFLKILSTHCDSTICDFDPFFKGIVSKFQQSPLPRPHLWSWSPRGNFIQFGLVLQTRLVLLLQATSRLVRPQLRGVHKLI